MYHCGRAIYGAHLIIAPGMGAVMRCRGGCAFAPPAGARSARDHGGGIAKANAPKPHLSGQPGGCRVNAPPDEPKVKAGGLREREQPGAPKIQNTACRAMFPVWITGSVPFLRIW